MHGYHAFRMAVGLCVTIVTTGCVASNPVYHVNHSKIPLDIRGAAFHLPRTRLALGFTQQTLSYVAGRHTKIVEDCENKVAGSVPELCTRLDRIGLSSLRPSSKDKDCLPASDKESRVGFKAFTLTSSAIPDPTQAYVVDLGRNWFQDFNFSMELDAYGVVGKAQAKTVEKAAEDALAFGLNLAVRAAGITPAAGTGIAPAKSATFSATEKAAMQDLATLEKLLRARAKLTAEIDTETLSRSAVAMTQLNAEIAQMTNAFTGKRTVEESDPQSIAFIPDASSEGEHITVHTFNHCGGTGTPDSIAINLTDAAKYVLPAPQTPQNGQETNYPFELSSLNVSDSKEAGWPHRIPVLTIAAIAVCKPTCGAFKPLGEVGIAQYGKVYRLPARTGGKSSNVAAVYSSLGSVTKIDVDQVGQAATPVFTTLGAAIAKNPEVAAPKEADLLAAEIALIKSRQELCRLIHGVDDERCLGANPPVK